MTNKADTKTLIREMQENVAKYGRENTTTYLMVQAINALQQQDRELEAVGAGGVNGPLMGRAPKGMVGGWIASQDQMPPPGVRVFWGDVDSNRVGYDFWAGDDYRWAPSHWMHIPEFPVTPTTSAESKGA